MTEQPASHGERRTYRRFACRCTPCRAANSAYQAALRQLKADGKIPLGSLVDVDLVRKLVKGMRVEGFTFVEMAKRLGLPCQQFRLHGDRVTVRKYLMVRRLYRTTMTEPT